MPTRWRSCEQAGAGLLCRGAGVRRAWSVLVRLCRTATCFGSMGRLRVPTAHEHRASAGLTRPAPPRPRAAQAHPAGQEHPRQVQVLPLHAHAAAPAAGAPAGAGRGAQHGEGGQPGGCGHRRATAAAQVGAGRLCRGRGTVVLPCFFFQGRGRAACREPHRPRNRGQAARGRFLRQPWGSPQGQTISRRAGLLNACPISTALSPAAACRRVQCDNLEGWRHAGNLKSRFLRSPLLHYHEGGRHMGEGWQACNHVTGMATRPQHVLMWAACVQCRGQAPSLRRHRRRRTNL